MGTVVGWFLFGMFVWGCVIVMQAFQNKVAPEMNNAMGLSNDDWLDDLGGAPSQKLAERDREIADLKQRIEVLEAIVTDRRYNWESELRR